MQGTYRLLGGGQELLESFVAAPGPAGWRYFGRIRRADTGEGLSTVDYVTDLDWGLVRFRTQHADGRQVVVVPSETGLEVWRGGPGPEPAGFPEASVVWSASPCSLIVAHHRLQALGHEGLVGLRLEARSEPEAVTIRLRPLGTTGVSTSGAGSTATRFEVTVGDRTLEALIRPDLPLECEDWFKLVA